MENNTTNPPAGGTESQGQPITVLSVQPPASAADFFAALGNPWRWKMMQFFAAGEVLSPTMIAGKLGRDFDGVSKHLKLMRKAGVISSMRGGDKRCEWYYIPKRFFSQPGLIDYGWCRIALGSGPVRS